LYIDIIMLKVVQRGQMRQRRQYRKQTRRN